MEGTASAEALRQESTGMFEEEQASAAGGRGQGGEYQGVKSKG